MTQPSGGTTVNAYDSNNRINAQWDPVATAAAGGAPNLTNNASSSTQFAYDFTGTGDDELTGTTTVTSPAAQGVRTVEQMQFHQGYLIKDTKNLGGATNEVSVTTVEYDPGTGMPSAVLDSSDNLTFTTYTQPGGSVPAGLVLTTQNAAGITSTLGGYNAFGEPTTSTSSGDVTYPDEYTATGAAGNLHSNQDGLGETIVYSYDAHGNLTKISCLGRDTRPRSPSMTMEMRHIPRM